MAWDFWKKVEEAEAGVGNPSAGFAYAGNAIENSNLFRKANQYGCNDSGDCGSGYACINGKCTKVWTKDGSNYVPNTCGETPIEWQNCKKGQEGGTNDTCGKATPGNCEKDPDCPGEKCCRQQADGSIRCVCGSCDENYASRCNVFCDQYYKSFGITANGCFTKDQDGFGECGGNICDECEICEDDIFGSGGKCERGEIDDPFNPVPCHCSSKCPEECHVCNKDVDSANFGDCEYSENNCAECCAISNYECPQCARYFGDFQYHCEPVTSRKTCIYALREKLFKQCEEDCKTEPDPCAPTDNFSRCVIGSAPVDPDTNPGGPSEISCPDGKTCKYTGYIEIGGKTCYLYDTWVTADIPEECKECDCNCHNDCPSCKLCGADGECYDDPDCNVNVDIYLDYELTRDRFGQCFSTYVCSKNEIVTGSSLLRTNVSIEDARKWSIVLQPQGPVNTHVKLCTGTCVDIGGQFQCQGGEANCTTPDQFAYIYDQDGNFVASYTVTRCWQFGFCNLRRWQETFDRFGSGSLRFEVVP